MSLSMVAKWRVIKNVRSKRKFFNIVTITSVSRVRLMHAIPTPRYGNDVSSNFVATRYDRGNSSPNNGAPSTFMSN